MTTLTGPLVLYWKAQKGMEGSLLVADLQEVKTALEFINSDYLCLLSDKDYILKIAGIYVDRLSKGKDEIDKFSRELKNAQEALYDTWVTLHEAKNQIAVTNWLREHENRERHEFFREVINELDSIQQTHDLDSCPNRPNTKILDQI